MTKMAGLAVIIIVLLLLHSLKIEGICVGNHMKASGLCPTRMFGPKCLSDCNCAQWDEECDQTTGCCSSGCAHGYIGTNCSMKLAVLNSVPTSPWQTNMAIRVRFKTWTPDMGGMGPVSCYQTLYKLFDVKDWIWGPKEHHRDVEYMEITIPELVPETTYSISIQPIVEPHRQGFQSPEILVKTKTNATTMPGAGVADGQTGQMGDRQLVNKLTYSLIAVGAALFIAIITIIVYAVCYKRLANSQKNAFSKPDTVAMSENSTYERSQPYTGSSLGYERPVANPSGPQYGPYVDAS